MQVQRRAFDEAISLVFIGLGGQGHRCGQRKESGVKRNAKDTGTNSFGQAVGQFLLSCLQVSY
jgi:hypothetical protein